MIGDSDFIDYWNQVTPENAGKHGLYEQNMDEYESLAMDQIYSFALAEDLPLKQHTFLFWCCGADPEWLMDLSASEIRQQLEEWMNDYFQMYPELDYVEVVNEPFQSPPPGKIREALGGDENYAWVRWMFTKAKENAPANVQLLINENNVLKGGDRLNMYKRLIEVLKIDGTLDGVGMQGHWLEGISAETIKSSLYEMQELDLPLYITEYDVNEVDDFKQKKILENQFPVFWEHPAVKGVTFWGHKENEIWRDQAYLIRSDGSERPALRWLRIYLQS
jgi:endo-1,4-beta-xylanase